MIARMWKTIESYDVFKKFIYSHIIFEHEFVCIKCVQELVEARRGHQNFP